MGNISVNGVIVLLSIVGAAAALLAAGRLLLHRHQTTSNVSLRCADYLNAAAALVLVVFLTLELYYLPLSYAVELWVMGRGPPVDRRNLPTLYTIDFIVSVLFWVDLYLVKFSFLMLYRTLFSISKAFRIAWIFVAAFTAATFLMNLIGCLWMCGNPSDLLHASACVSRTAAVNIRNLTIMGVTTNVLSDFAIMGLAIGMLPGLHISLGKKLALGGVFLLVCVDVAFDILRAVSTLQKTLVTTFNTLEPALAVIICALPVYYGPACKTGTHGLQWIRGQTSAITKFGSGGSSRSNLLPRLASSSPKSHQENGGSSSNWFTAWFTSASMSTSDDALGDSAGVTKDEQHDCGIPFRTAKPFRKLESTSIDSESNCGIGYEKATNSTPGSLV